MVKDIIIEYKNDRFLTNSESMGIKSENLQGKIIFKPVPFVDGACRLYIEDRGSILMEKEEDCYTLDILSSLLTEPSLDICFKITEPQTDKGTPIFCSKIIHFKVLDTIESNEEIPEQYPTWIETFDSKIAQLEALEEDVEQAEVERNAAVQEAIENIHDMTEAYNQNAVDKTNAFNTNATNKTNAFNAHVSNKEAEFDTDTDTIVSTKKAELDSYEQTKESELDTHTNSLKNDLDTYESAKETELNSYTTEKKTEINTYTGTKKTELDTYEGAKETELNTYANGLKNDFDTNATNKTNAFNTNATDKTSAFDNNATAKTTTFNENAEEKTGDFNDNVDEKTNAFNTNTINKTAEFDAHTEEIQEDISDIQEFIESELEQDITEKATRIDTADAAKWYGDLDVEGRTGQTQLTGKNKFNVANVNNLAMLGSSLSRNSDYRGYSLPVQTGEIYTISRKDTSGNNRFRIGFTKEVPAVGVTFYNENGAEGKNNSFDSTISGTVTVPSEMNYLFLYLSNQNENITEELEIQIEQGSTATSYETYCGRKANS